MFIVYCFSLVRERALSKLIPLLGSRAFLRSLACLYIKSIKGINVCSQSLLSLGGSAKSDEPLLVLAR